MFLHIFVFHLQDFGTVTDYQDLIPHNSKKEILSLLIELNLRQNMFGTSLYIVTLGSKWQILQYIFMAEGNDLSWNNRRDHTDTPCIAPAAVRFLNLSSLPTTLLCNIYLLSGWWNIVWTLFHIVGQLNTPLPPFSTLKATTARPSL